MLETSLVARLAPIITNLYPLVAPKKTPENAATWMPAVLYNRSDTVPVDDLSVGITANAKLWLQVDCYDYTYLAAKTLAETIRENLEVWVDDEVQSVSWTGEHDTIDNTTESTLYRTMLNFEIYVNLD